MTTTDELIFSAAARLNPDRVGDRLFDVAAALVTDRGVRYEGVCIGTARTAKNRADFTWP